MNATNSCISSANQKAYKIGTDENGKNKLTKQIGDYFTIVDIEVYQINV